MKTWQRKIEDPENEDPAFRKTQHNISTLDDER